MGYNIPYNKPSKAKLLFRQKYVYPDGAIIAMKAWAVPRTTRTPEGYKYSLVYIDKGRRILGYDNAESKGHHKHAGGKEESVVFDSLEALVDVFLKEISNIRRVEP